MFIFVFALKVFFAGIDMSIFSVVCVVLNFILGDGIASYVVGFFVYGALSCLN